MCRRGHPVGCCFQSCVALDPGAHPFGLASARGHPTVANAPVPLPLTDQTTRAKIYVAGDLKKPYLCRAISHPCRYTDSGGRSFAGPPFNTFVALDSGRVKGYEAPMTSLFDVGDYALDVPDAKPR
jgi:hypothetical protein